MHLKGLKGVKCSTKPTMKQHQNILSTNKTQIIKEHTLMVFQLPFVLKLLSVVALYCAIVLLSLLTITTTIIILA